MTKGKNVLTTGDVAKICNVAPRTVSKWFDSGQLKGYRIPGSKDRRIPVSELARFMKLHNIPASAAALPLGKIRVLIVDSDRNATSALVDALQAKADYEIQSVHTSFETGATAHKFAPHVLLINLMAQDIDAMDICKKVHSSEELQTIKIIALANHLSESESAALLQKGFDGCVSNTADIAEVISKIEQATAIIYY